MRKEDEGRIIILSMGFIIVAMAIYDLECYWTYENLMLNTLPIEYARFTPEFLAN